MSTYAGKQATLKSSFNELNDTVGSIWLPLLKKVDDATIPLVDAYERWAEKLWGVKPPLDADVDTANNFGQALERIKWVGP